MKLEFNLFNSYGTVASELPIYNIKVINASKNQPHADFNFQLILKI